MNPENTLSDYHKIDAEVRTRAKQVKLEYAARVPQAKWLRLDIGGAVLLTPAEFFQLPQSSREFFLDKNSSHYRNDRVAMRGERTVLLDGYYSGGPTGEMRVDYFLETAQRYQKAVPEVLGELSDDQEGQWKAKLAVWDNRIPEVLVKDLVDEQGAGDTYMGTMLASLLPLGYKDWRENHIINAAKVASYAASLVTQSMHSRLTPSMARLVQSYERGL